MFSLTDPIRVRNLPSCTCPVPFLIGIIFQNLVSNESARQEKAPDTSPINSRHEDLEADSAGAKNLLYQITFTDCKEL